jgi:hypothetical protein
MWSKEDPKANPMGNSEANDSEPGNQDIFDKCYLCGRWWWQRTMKLVNLPDQAGYIGKYVCLECIEEVSQRSIRALKGVA